MTKYLLFFCFIFLFFTNTSAQIITEEKWYEGKIFFKDSSIVLTLLNYDFNSQILRIKSNGQLRTFNPFQILGFEFLDSELDTLRTFSVFSYPKTPNYPVDMIFEVLEKGKFSLLSQDVLVADYNDPSPMFNNSPGMGGNMIEDRQITYRYLRTHFVYEEKKKKFTRLSKPKKYFSNLSSQFPTLKKFMKENKLKPARERDMKRILKWMNG
ncbi:MAG: hypothetical protein A3G23_14210 [Bacteroidetes bacterium RIFCSPLOWO2_12_FULL_37_12]|nr:MAG: hypothetical protein A3G23_14210 [Bacteroidetes bacterium RIFCSPLOWO2_12_FULL_37_12]